MWRCDSVPWTMNWRAGKRDAAAVAVPPLPDGEADQLETGELAADEVDLCVGQLARRFPAVRCEES